MVSDSHNNFGVPGQQSAGRGAIASGPFVTQFYCKSFRQLHHCESILTYAQIIYSSIQPARPARWAYLSVNFGFPIALGVAAALGFFWSLAATCAVPLTRSPQGVTLAHNYWT